MAGRSKNVLDVREMLRRVRMGETARRIARDMGVSRVTVKKYRKWFEEQGLLERPELPSPAELMSGCEGERSRRAVRAGRLRWSLLRSPA